MFGFYLGFWRNGGRAHSGKVLFWFCFGMVLLNFADMLFQAAANIFLFEKPLLDDDYTSLYIPQQVAREKFPLLVENSRGTSQLNLQVF